jgi:hypothetical protein
MLITIKFDNFYCNIFIFKNFQNYFKNNDLVLSDPPWVKHMQGVLPYPQTLDKAVRDKYSNLLQTLVNYGRNKFQNIGYRMCVYKAHDNNVS